MNYTKRPKTKITIKKTRLKIKTKNKLEGNQNFLIGGLN
jgi:hypothetical protein